jgi:hypothetical protein
MWELEEQLLFPACHAVLSVEASLIDLLLRNHCELRVKKEPPNGLQLQRI